jgi:two-component system CAI-1 autoinducer sensor kinase/phosphatase CqsS
MNILSYFTNSYKDYYKYGTYRLKYTGIVGTISYPLFYFLRIKLLPPHYENFYFVLIGIILCLSLAIHEQWPVKLKPYFVSYSYFVFIYCLPFFHTFLILHNNPGIAYIFDVSMALFFICLLFDWKNAILAYIIGTSAAILIYLNTTQNPVPIKFSRNIQEFIVIIIGSSLFKYSNRITEEEKAKALKSLAASIAHEMRNPFNSIINSIGYIKILLPKKPIATYNNKSTLHQITTKNLIEIYNTIEQSDVIINRGNKIIDSILDNIQGKEIEVKKFGRVLAVKAIQKAVNDFGYENIEDKKLIKLNFESDFEFFGDEDLFIYILFNLLKNSLYYKNKPDFAIEITTKNTTTHNIVTVKDYGVGIEKSKIKEIFESFITSGKEGGTGLGLDFCRRTMMSFKGEIKCESELGKWTEFSLIFPLYNSQLINNIKAAILKEKRILTVDDQDINRLVIKRPLTNLVDIVDEATNGREALEKINQNQYDLIFMDIEMPVMNGYEAAKNIRNHNSELLSKETIINYQKVPIIAVTSLLAETAKEKALFFGMNDFVQKPIRKEILIELLEKWFFIEEKFENNNLLTSVSNNSILVVDDEKFNLKYNCKLLENFGFKVKTALNGEEAAKILDLESCDLILMDIHMPLVNGFKATKRIREGSVFKNFKNFKSIPILGLSGNNDEETLIKSKESGMNTLIGKPILPDQLVEIIKNYLA